MIFAETKLPGAWIIEVEPTEDDRGSFARTFCEREFAAHGLITRFPQCNLSSNRRAGTLRGMHYQVPPHAEVKLVRCTSGAVADVIVDLRHGSPTRFEWICVELRAETRRALYVPEGFAHGYVTLADDSEIFYQMSAFHEPSAARGLRWDDPLLAIDWPRRPALISARDAGFADVRPEELEL